MFYEKFLYLQFRQGWSPKCLEVCCWHLFGMFSIKYNPIVCLLNKSNWLLEGSSQLQKNQFSLHLMGILGKLPTYMLNISISIVRQRPKECSYNSVLQCSSKQLLNSVLDYAIPSNVIPQKIYPLNRYYSILANG